jgi:glycine cleavage system H lipoate-binding protein
MEKDGRVKIGIDDFLQHITGPLTQVKLKTAGEKVRKGEKIFTITREGKQLEICSPVSGYIRQYNDELLSNPEKLNSSPYAEGWVYQIEPANWLRETRFMFMADKFKEWLDDEFIRLKDFLATSANSNAVVYNHIVLQDGGELTDNVLADLGPEVWEDFQTHFLDTSK